MKRNIKSNIVHCSISVIYTSIHQSIYLYPRVKNLQWTHYLDYVQVKCWSLNFLNQILLYPTTLSSFFLLHISFLCFMWGRCLMDCEQHRHCLPLPSYSIKTGPTSSKDLPVANKMRSFKAHSLSLYSLISTCSFHIE